MNRVAVLHSTMALAASMAFGPGARLVPIEETRRRDAERERQKEDEGLPAADEEALRKAEAKRARKAAKRLKNQ